MPARILSSLLSVLCVSAALAQPAREGEGPHPVDRLLAAVNGRVITEGDLELSRTLADVLRLGRGDPVSTWEADLQRLIDLELLRQELSSFAAGGAEEERLQARLEDLKKVYAEIGGLGFLLGRLGLQETELIRYLRLQVTILRLIDLRFRPFAEISESEIDAYYSGKLAPELRAAGLPAPPRDQVAADIRNILIEERINAAMDDWLQNVRANSRIEFFIDLAARPEAGA